MVIEENFTGDVIINSAKDNSTLETGDTSTILITAISATIFVLGIFGNITVCIGFLRYKSLRTKTNMFLLNLAISDLLIILFNVPLNTAVFISRFYYHFGPVMCKIQYFIHGTVIAVVTLTLVTIGYDRYRKIVYTPRKITFTRNQILYIILGIWILSICLNAAQLQVLELIPASEVIGKFYCIEVWPLPKYANRRVYSIVLFIALYVMPIALLMFFYTSIVRKVFESRPDGVPSVVATQCKRKVIRMMIVIITLFFICITPNYILIFLYDIFPDEHVNNIPIPPWLSVVSLWVAFGHSLCNPIVYFVCYNRFRSIFINMFSCQSRSSNGKCIESNSHILIHNLSSQPSAFSMATII